MAADLTPFNEALREAMTGMLEDFYGKPYPGPGHIVELTPGQQRENAEWRRRRDAALAWIEERHGDIFAEAKEKFGVELYEEQDGGGFFAYDSEPHSPTYIPDDQAAYDQWRRDHPGDWGRLLFALERK